MTADDPDHMSKSELMRATGWSSGEIADRRGEPDKLVVEPDRHIKLYSRQRAADAGWKQRERRHPKPA